MILIADSGSTKTQWIAVSNDGTADYSLVTSGINAVMMPPDAISRLLSDELTPAFDMHSVEQIFWYGAGCIDSRICNGVSQAIVEATGCKSVTVDTDMTCAARALCGHRRGIACILGTGSNSCLYDGEKIIDNVSPLGFILGDEGSGAVLGRTLVGDVLKHQLPPDLCDEFHSRYRLSRTEIITRTYREPGANRFLASFAPFLSDHIERPEIERLVTDAFCRFLQRNVMSYDGWQSLAINFTGSIAWHFARQLKTACDLCGCRFGQVLRSPAEGIAAYHLNSQQSLSE